MTKLRDAKRAGMLPSAFLREVNAFISKRRSAGAGSLPMEVAHLSIDECLALRLFSGPAHRPINDFVRSVSLATSEQRWELVRHAGHTFAATVHAICGAIRKLADVSSPEDLQAPIYIAMRGEPPRDFWSLPHERARVSTVTTAFVSVSRERSASVARMQSEGGNLLWELHQMVPGDACCQCAADVSLLSQFPEEGECLLPPGTLLTVDLPEGSGAKDAATMLVEAGKSFVHVSASACFL